MELTNHNNDKKRRRVVDPSSMMYGKVPPQAKELEEAILGAIMLEKRAIEAVTEILQAESFYVDANQKIFSAILGLKTKGVPIDTLTVVEELKFREELDAVGGPYYLTKLTSRIFSSAHIEAHARIVLQKFLQREVIRICGELLAMAYEDSTDVFELMDFAEENVVGLRLNNVKSNFTTLQAVLVSNLQRIEELRMRDEAITGVPSGFPDLDKITCGWQNTDLIILAARPSVGKSAFALTLGKRAAQDFRKKWLEDKSVPKKPQKAVGIFSLEMSNYQSGNRILSAESNVFAWRLRNGRLGESELRQLYKSADDMADLKIYMDDTAALKMADFKSKARKMVTKFNVGLIIFDYMQLGTEPSKKVREQEIAAISGTMKAIAKELNVPVIALSQMSRDFAKATDGSREPQLSDLRECLATNTSFIYGKNSVQYNNNSRTKLLSLNKQSLKEMTSDNILKTENTVFRLKTGTGRFIDCTAKHRILTSSGYKELKNITNHDSIAVAVGWSDKKGQYFEESRFIGWMIGNGCMYGYNSPSFITRDKVISDDFVSYIEKRFKFSPKYHPHYKSKVYQWDITKDSVRVSGGNSVTAWLKSKDLWGSKAKDKSIPHWFMETADKKSITELLQGLWETDGCIAIIGERLSIQYSTTSYFLGNQVLFLLAKIGIIGNIDNGRMNEKSTTPCFKIFIDSADQQRVFRENIPLRGYKNDRLLSYTLTNRQSFSFNKLGRDTTVSIRNTMDSFKISRRVQVHGKRRLTKRNFVEILKDHPKELENYKWLASDNIFWDPVDEITEIGVQEIFDRHVPKTNNFVVNGIIVHNSGAIEQDADMVIFLWKPTDAQIAEDAALAEIFYAKIAKHRNGDSNIRFLGKFIKETQQHEYLKMVDGFLNPIGESWTPLAAKEIAKDEAKLYIHKGSRMNGGEDMEQEDLPF